jgi:hypothetical protein
MPVRKLILEDVQQRMEVEPIGPTVQATLAALRLPHTMFQAYVSAGGQLTPIPHWIRYDSVPDTVDEVVVRALRNTLFDTILPPEPINSDGFEHGVGFENVTPGDGQVAAALSRTVVSATDAQIAVVSEVDRFVDEFGVAERGCVFGVSGGGDSNALAYGLRSSLPSGKLFAFTLTFRDLMTTAAADRATVLCQDLGIDHVVLDPARLTELLGVTTSLDALYDDFAQTFGHEAMHFFGTFLILKTARMLGEQRGLPDLAFGYNREDLLAETLFMLTNGRAPLEFPVRAIGDQRIIMPVWRVPKLLLDACHPRFSLENYRERDSHTTRQRSLAFFLGHALDSAYPSFGLSLLDGVRQAFAGRFATLAYDASIDVYLTHLADDESRTLVRELLSRHFAE